MGYAEMNPYQTPFAAPVSYAEESERTAFLRRTYAHLGGAIGAFVLLEWLIFSLVDTNRLVGPMVSGWNWLIVLGLFMVVSTVANRWALSATSKTAQYAGLLLYVAAQAVIFIPLLNVASRVGQDVIPTAGIITAIVFGGLTSMVFITRADFSWLGRFLWLAGLAALGLIACSIIFGFGLGLLFSTVMVTIAAGYILYETSNVLHHYRTDQYVAAALALFASVAILFWYVLQIVMRSRD
jgi:FtsH-binding integral membrane protein